MRSVSMTIRCNRPGFLPCYLAKAADEALDDGVLESTLPGKAAIVSGTCPAADEDAEIAYAVSLN